MKFSHLFIAGTVLVGGLYLGYTDRAETGLKTEAQATPAFSPAAGQVAFGTQVVISSPGADAIYYTTNGSAPTTASTLYTAPIVINSAMMIKALAVKAGSENSAIASANYSQASTSLRNLTISGSPANYSFNAGTTTYDGVMIPNGVASITITPTGAGVITVDGQPASAGIPSGAISLAPGEQKTLTIVAAETGKRARTYTINVTRRSTAQAIPTLKLQMVAQGFRSPMALAFPDDGTGRTFICDQSGVISVMDKNGVVSSTPFLDMRGKIVVNQGYDERGLLNIVLHPQFRTNRKFYVNYSAPLPAPVQGLNNKTVFSEYRVSATNPNVADTASEKILITLDDPQSNHNGGGMAFGPDGYLYISIGDGGGQGDQHGPIGNAQNLSVLFGKMLRIDVDRGSPYAIPADNPFVGQVDVRPEIWAYGFRNVWRFSFDKVSKQLFAGEVGQNIYEEVDIVEKGGNYGWRVMEATHCYNPVDGCVMTGLKLPITEYPHTTGISIAGGYIYNGKAMPDYKGRYIFGDYAIGRVFYLQKSGNAWNREEITLTNKPAGTFFLLSFAEDLDGEIYVLAKAAGGISDTKGIVYKLVKP